MYIPPNACDIVFDPDTAITGTWLQEDNRKGHQHGALGALPTLTCPAGSHTEVAGAGPAEPVPAQVLLRGGAWSGIYVGLTCQGIDRKGEEQQLYLRERLPLLEPPLGRKGSGHGTVMQR